MNPCTPNERSADIDQCESGFTLLEMSIVLAILGVLLGSLIQPLGSRIDTLKRAETRVQLRAVLDATKGFLGVQRRLPCPASPESGGWELEQCAGAYAAGFVPATTLGLKGPRDAQGLLLDSWGQRIRYVTSASDHPSRGLLSAPDFTGEGEIDRVGLRWLRSEIIVCAQGGGQQCPRNSIRANQVPVLVFSTAGNQQSSTDQLENLDADNLFVMRDPSKNTADEFDDILDWVSENEFFYEWIHSM